MEKTELKERLLKIQELKSQLAEALTEVIMAGHAEVVETNYSGMKLKIDDKNDVNAYTSYDKVMFYNTISFVIPAGRKKEFEEAYELGKLQAGVKQAKIELANAENKLKEFIAKR